jgi:ABC-2 type transport system permease protein
MNIFIRELKQNRKSIIIWSIAMILFIVMGMQKYSSMTVVGGDAFLGLIDKMPNFLKVMWGLDKLDITSAIGYFGILFSYLLLMSTIHSSMLGATIVYKEERDKTAEFLMTKPISRSRVLSFKIVSAITNILIFNIVTFIASYFTLKGFTTEPILNQLILSMLSMFIIQLLFLMIGVFIASIRPKKSNIIAMGIMMSLFFLGIIIDLSEKLTAFKFLSPFKYFEPKDFYLTHTLNIWYILLSLGIVILLGMFSYKNYKKRDLILS